MPMLAVKFNIGNIVFPIFVQPKLDGIRCISTNGYKLSRKNRDILTVNHIDLSELPNDIMLDGELYVHGKSFQENTKLIKKYRRDETEEVSYNVYDLPSHTGNFEERYKELIKIINKYTLPNVDIVPTYLVHNEHELMEYHKQFIRKGYEGTIIRTNDTKYEFNKRSKSLLKLKDFIDKTYKIVDIVPSEKLPDQGIVKCTLTNGRTFTCGMKIDHKERRYMLFNKYEYIGKIAEVRFFEYTDDGIPRHPVFHGIRLDK